VELHEICASKGLAPEILRFQELHGGWLVVAMEEIDTVDYTAITSFPEAGKWKKDITELVNGFHQKGLVHGDLHLANFLFTKSSNPQKMLFIDFDWRGKDGEVMFPHAELIGELGVSSKQLCG
jgi:thiamine kinase-like enzyme